MKRFCFGSFFLLAVVSLAQTGVVREVDLPPIEASTCPDDSTISPCICLISEGRVDIQCLEDVVNETTIQNVFREIRRVNKIPEGRGIHMRRFELEDSQLEELDMAPFYGCKMDYLQLFDNSRLTKLVTSGNSSDHGSIQAKSFNFVSAPINRKGFGDALKYFSNQMTIFEASALSLYEPKISADADDDSEFLPGLSALTNLEALYLADNNITGRLDADTWILKELTNLEWISLAYNNINEIGENVFYFYQGVDFFDIYLDNNKLNESSFHPNSGISRAGRQTNLYLQSNQISSLPALLFEPFLNAHPQNSLELYGNPLICDERLSWLKSRRDELKERVGGGNCINDQGHTIFDSDLIPDLKQH